jgi:hypothetical protein
VITRSSKRWSNRYVTTRGLLHLKAAAAYLGLSPRAVRDLCNPRDPKITFSRIDRYN